MSDIRSLSRKDRTPYLSSVKSAANTFPLPSTHTSQPCVSPGIKSSHRKTICVGWCTGAVHAKSLHKKHSYPACLPPFSLTNPSSAAVRHWQHCCAAQRCERFLGSECPNRSRCVW
jgi:hypothetical protein